jgi:uncharacterized membrane protein
VLLAADDSVPFLVAVFLGAAMIAAGVVIAVTTNRAIDGRLGPNRAAGIRTKATRASSEAWVAAHRAAKPWMQFASMIAVVTGFAVIALSSSSTALFTVLLVGAALMAIVAIIGAVFADREAKRVNATG